jgi:CheY-like chemotaxis protein
MGGHLPILRILLIEDDDGRARKITGWLPSDYRVVRPRSAGQVLGVIQRDRDTYAGIILDHDLQGNVATDMDEFLSGSDVVKAITAQVSPDIPVLVHSMNPVDAPNMVRELEQKGFRVTRIPMNSMTAENLGEWLEEVRESWADNHE